MPDAHCRGVGPLRQQALTDATSLFEAMLLANLWRIDSPYGKFTRGGHNFGSGGRAPWWNAACSKAATKLRRLAGTPQVDEAKREFRSAVDAARSGSCEEAIKHMEMAAQNSLDIDSRTSKQIKNFPRPKKSATRLMKINGTVIGEHVVTRLWPEFFKAQSSLRGPQKPADLLAELEIEQQQHDEVMLHSDVTETVPHPGGADPKDPYSDDLREAHDGYDEELIHAIVSDLVKPECGNGEHGPDLMQDEASDDGGSTQCGDDDISNESNDGCSTADLSTEFDDADLHELFQREEAHAKAARADIESWGVPTCLPISSWLKPLRPPTSTFPPLFLTQYP